MKKSSVIKLIETMIAKTQMTMENVENGSRVDFYHQGSVDALKIALDMVNDIESGESELLASTRND